MNYEINKNKDGKNSDMKNICQSLMKEMLWSMPSQQIKDLKLRFTPQSVSTGNSKNSIEMFALKKHMTNVPELKDKNLTDFSKCDYNSFKTS